MQKYNQSQGVWRFTPLPHCLDLFYIKKGVFYIMLTDKQIWQVFILCGDIPIKYVMEVINKVLEVLSSENI